MKKKVTLLRQPAGDLPGRLADLIKFLQGKLDDVPEISREGAQVEMDSDEYVECRIHYWRPMTPEEEEDAKEREAMVLKVADERDRLRYEKLKVKFGGTP